MASRRSNSAASRRRRSGSRAPASCRPREAQQAGRRSRAEGLQHRQERAPPAARMRRSSSAVASRSHARGTTHWYWRSRAGRRCGSSRAGRRAGRRTAAVCCRERSAPARWRWKYSALKARSDRPLTSETGGVSGTRRTRRRGAGASVGSVVAAEEHAAHARCRAVQCSRSRPRCTRAAADVCRQREELVSDGTAARSRPIHGPAHPARGCSRALDDRRR